MRKFYTTLALILFTIIAQSQIVNIPDANFKLALLDYQPAIDTNSDGEIQVSEAQTVITLDFTGITTNSSLYITNSQNLIGLEAFVNLETLIIHTNYGITSLDLSMLTHLTSLQIDGFLALSNINITNLSALNIAYIYDCQLLSNLDLTGTNNLTRLDCSMNNLTSLNVSNLTNLQSLNCGMQTVNGGIGISSLDLTGLNNITNLGCSLNNLSSLNITNLTTLTTLECSNNPISNLNLSNSNQLTNLSCRNNQLSNLDVSNLANLTYLDCALNHLTTLDVTNLTNLNRLYVYSNQLTSLNVSTLVNLNTLHCDSNQLTNLDVSNLHNLETLNCNGNQLTNLNVSNLGYLTNINAGFNLFTTLDFSTTGLTSPVSTLPRYSFTSNPNLTYVNLKNGLYVGPTNIFLDSCPNLQYICADDQSIQNIQQELANENYTNVQVNSYCTFVPGGVHNTITGTATLDINNNGCDSNDIHPKDLKININDGAINGATFCNNNGTYSFFTLNGNFVLTPQFQNSYFTVNPVSTTLNFPLLDGSTQTQDFCITPNGIHNDIDVTILPIGNARPGFDANYQLVFKNKGNQTLSGSLNFTFDDSILDFVSASPSVNSQSVNNLNWNYSNLVPFESRTIYLTLNVNSPMETPPVNIGDHLTYTATINPVSGDETVGDNTFNLNQIVMGSFDPNDKVCLEGTTISPAKVGDYLHYVIRFQNSGTAPAENIVVKDMIDTTKFDIATLQLTAASHPQVTRITGNKAEFIFEEINLPAEQDNEPASHGFVAFKIKTKNNLVVGNSVANTADIYFDYNFPITTNTATTTITTLGINEFENKSVAIAPNPTKNEVTITSKDIITSIQLFDVQGRLIETKLNSATEAKLDVSKQLSGIYFVKVYTENGVKIEKIIKE